MRGWYCDCCVPIAEATECYLKAVEIYTDMVSLDKYIRGARFTHPTPPTHTQGRFSLAARYHNTVADIFETEVQDYEQAITHYEQASDFYKGEDAISYVGSCVYCCCCPCCAEIIYIAASFNNKPSTNLVYGCTVVYALYG